MPGLSCFVPAIQLMPIYLINRFGARLQGSEVEDILGFRNPLSAPVIDSELERICELQSDMDRTHIGCNTLNQETLARTSMTARLLSCIVSSLVPLKFQYTRNLLGRLPLMLTASLGVHNPACTSLIIRCLSKLHGFLSPPIKVTFGRYSLIPLSR